MDDRCARWLNGLNRDFYRREHESFSATRGSGWPGWRQVVELAQPVLGCADSDCARVLDVACGNLRFERFVADELPGVTFEWHTVDNCAQLLTPEPRTIHVDMDVVDELLNRCLGETPCDAHDVLCFVDEPVDLAVCFGFFHHVPGAQARGLLLKSLVASLRPGGMAAVSLWRFADDALLGPKSLAAHERCVAELRESGAGDVLDGLEEGDFILGWQGQAGVYRYCHSFSEDDIHSLLTCINGEANLVGRFEGDGHSRRLNTYLVLHRPD